ncbi:VOC family protein [Roseibium litorale]|uniref:VOC family protein n=1 Tax=Roseibium litorale TaxID=2803841 RepID=A0ABR9CHX1_9HYPH|nr:VOC family protein [Roseibium litorale]MBD8890323.1 VOC family protein [Roseibium litorale]
MLASSNGIQGVYETHLPVRDLQASIAFYRDVLGLELAGEFPARKIAFFWVGDKRTGMLGLWEYGSAPLFMTLHFAFRTEREAVLSACEKLQAAGIQPLGITNQPISEPEVIGWMPAAVVYFKDPDGHTIEFLNVLDGEPDKAFGIQPYSAWASRTAS